MITIQVLAILLVNPVSLSSQSQLTRTSCLDPKVKAHMVDWVAHHRKYHGPRPYLPEDSLDAPPEPLSAPELVSPIEVLAAGYEGSIVVEGVVETDGRIRFVEVLESEAVLSSPSPPASDSITVSDARRAFQRAVITKVNQTRYRPGQKGGQAVPVVLCFWTAFSLRP